MQYFKYCKEFNKEDRIAFENIKERRENALIAITGFGYIYLKDYLYSILKVLRDKKWGIIPWKTKFKGDLKFFLSAEGIYELCFNALNFNFEECCEPVSLSQTISVQVGRQTRQQRERLMILSNGWRILRKSSRIPLNSVC